VNLVSEFVKLGRDVAVCLLRAEGDLFSAVEALPVDVLDLSMRSARHAAVAVGRLARFFASWQPDVVYATLWSATAVAGAAWALTRKGFRMVTVEHNVLPWYAARVRFGRLKMRAVVSVHRRADRVIVPSPLVREELMKLGLSPHGIKVIPNPVQIPQDAAPSDPSASRPVVLACVGRLFRYKGIQHVIRAVSILRRDMGVDVLLKVAGEGPRMAELRALAADLGVGGQVLFHGWVQDMSAFYRTSDVVVHVAESESFGNVVAEAMAHARPVLVSAALLKSLPFIRPGGNVLVTTGTAADIAQRLTRALQEPEYLRRIAHQARMDVMRACDPQVVARSYLDAAAEACDA